MLHVGEKLDALARLSLPGLMTLTLIVVFTAPTGLLSPTYLMPDILMISVFYWTSFRPTTMPFWAIFLLGIFQDALFGTLLGVTALAMMALRLLTVSFRLTVVGESFLASWLGFSLLAIIITGAQWIITGAAIRQWIPLDPVATQWMLTVFSYPLFHLLFTAVYGWLPPATGNTTKPRKLFS